CREGAATGAVRRRSRSVRAPQAAARTPVVSTHVAGPRRARGSRPPQGHVRIVYLGPVAPHWEVQSEFGERSVIEEFRQRALARLLLLPPHDPQFRRNRERVARDAEREALILEWDLGIPDEELAEGAGAGQG